MHTGIDIDGYSGQPIVAAKDGVVVLAEYYSGYGNAVVIDHGGGYATPYGHMSRFAVRNGQSVEQGEIIGYVGCTGSCTGDHLHFEVRINGDPVDPMPYLP
jgi:murein DD-endopeptidase MepM/ murein hydrolase activator NlpD